MNMLQQSMQPCAGARQRAAFSSRNAAAFVPSIHAPRRRLCIAAAQAQSNDPFADIKKIAKKIQGALPIIGLVSRLAATDGGFDDQTYPEFCRGMLDKAPQSMSRAIKELEKHGKMATSRYILLVLWMTTSGLGLVTGKEIVAAARRLRVTQDIEVEIDRFEGSRAVTRKKYDMMAPPQASPVDQATVILDALCTMCLGLKEGAVPDREDGQWLADIVLGVLPELSPDTVAGLVADRPKRATAYINN